MSRLDIIIFGATGFTGRKAVEEAVRISQKIPLTWGIAGRSQKKLDKVLDHVSKVTGTDVSKVRTFIADVDDYASLKEMTVHAKVVANCCGPYRLYGEPVVLACIETKTHLVDVSGEPQFIESQQLNQDAAARAAGVYIVSACGFDSVPNDLGVVFLQKNFKGTLNSVESYLSSKIAPEYASGALSGVINYGTWESLVYSLSNWSELSDLRKKLYPRRLPALQPRLKPRSAIHRHQSRWCVPFPGADASVVYRTQRYLHETENQRPVQFKAYLKMSNIFMTALLVVTSAIVYACTQFNVMRNLLLKYPRLFSLAMVTREGPKEEVMNNTTFRMDLYGEGWAEGTDVKGPPNKKIVGMVSGINPGYGATVTALLWSAITILREQDKMPQGGGVLTTGAAFKNTKLIENLNDNKLTFNIVKN